MAHKLSPTPQTGSEVKALVLRTAGTNCDRETIFALEQAGAVCDLVHINQLMLGRVRLHPYHILVIPGGFSYGDDISAGKVLANEMRLRLKDQLMKFVKTGKLVIGICNGFQVLVKAGLLPGEELVDDKQTVTLALNDSSRFQCEWVGLRVEKSAAQWLNNLPAVFELPMAHGEGKFVAGSAAVLKKLKSKNQIVFRYSPENPNGSEDAIAGICNPQGNVVGLMPHPERHLYRFHHPNWTETLVKPEHDWGAGYWFWKKAVLYAQTLPL